MDLKGHQKPRKSAIGVLAERGRINAQPTDFYCVTYRSGGSQVQRSESGVPHLIFFDLPE
jgi:hypothetical protein